MYLVVSLFCVVCLFLGVGVGSCVVLVVGCF